jgi:hypothetical protein
VPTVTPARDHDVPSIEIRTLFDPINQRTNIFVRSLAQESIVEFKKGLAVTTRSANIREDDGHAEFIGGTKRDYEFTLQSYSDIKIADGYMSLMFKAFDLKDFTTVRKTFYK